MSSQVVFIGFCDWCGVRGDNRTSIVRHGMVLDLCEPCGEDYDRGVEA